MTKGKILRNGNSQAVRLPKEFRFKGDEVYVKRVGQAIILMPKDEPWEMFERSLGEFTDDYMEEGPKTQIFMEDMEEWA
jgi:antitoxin VapB